MYFPWCASVETGQNGPEYREVVGRSGSSTKRTEIVMTKELLLSLYETVLLNRHRP